MDRSIGLAIALFCAASVGSCDNSDKLADIAAEVAAEQISSLETKVSDLENRLETLESRIDDACDKLDC